VIAALYVQPGGVYYGLPDVDPWGPPRDAREYAGPHPVVAHPPCARWGRYWHGGPSVKIRKQLGDDGGCFASALSAVRQFGGVLEHPAHTHAWRKFLLPPPPASGGWVAGICGGWACHVEQRHYGHRARKATWLYAYGCGLPELCWGAALPGVRLDPGYHSAEERRAAKSVPPVERLSKRECAATPLAFRDLLLSIARGCQTTV
jgi:hypothetical protein